MQNVVRMGLCVLLKKQGAISNMKLDRAVYVEYMKVTWRYKDNQPHSHGLGRNVYLFVLFH